VRLAETPVIQEESLFNRLAEALKQLMAGIRSNDGCG
jgi:hypothetical protein